MTPEEFKEWMQDRRDQNVMESWHVRLEMAIDVLAWHLAKDEGAEETAWPKGVYFFLEPLLMWLSFRDPIFFRQAKKDLALDIREYGIEAGDRPMVELTTTLLALPEPGRRTIGGDHVARNLLIYVAVQLGEEVEGWGSKRDFNGPNKSEVVRRLCDRLNSHPALGSLPDAVPSESTVRASLAWTEKSLPKLGVPKALLEGAFIGSTSFPVW